MARLKLRHRQHATDGRVFLHVTFEVKPANEAAFFAAFNALIDASTSEPGCIKYQVRAARRRARAVRELELPAAGCRSALGAARARAYPAAPASIRSTSSPVWPIARYSSRAKRTARRTRTC